MGAKCPTCGGWPLLSRRTAAGHRQIRDTYSSSLCRSGITAACLNHEGTVGFQEGVEAL